MSGGQFDWGGRLPKVTEALKVTSEWLETIFQSVKAKGSLTVRETSRTGTKVGLSDPVVPSGRAIAQRIKVTSGITAYLPKVPHRRGGLAPRCRPSHPGAEAGSKGWAVRPLKRHASWVQNVVRQFGPYPSWAQDI